MSRENIRDLILERVVVHYIETPEPIGSVQLQGYINIEISSATIRNYFKKLVDDGYLAQPHTSSGRVPTSLAFKEFWNNKLNEKKEIKISDSNLSDRSAKNSGIYVVISKDSTNSLKDVYSVEEKFIICSFENGEILLKYSKILDRFLREFIGYEIRDLLKIAQENRIDSLVLELEKLLAQDVSKYNLAELYSIANQNGEWAKNHFYQCYSGIMNRYINDGIYFEEIVPKDYMIYKTKAILNDKSVSILTLGHVSRDFGNFIYKL